MNTHFGHRHPTVMLACLAFTATLVSLNFCVVLPLVPLLPDLLGASESSVSWVVTSTLLVGAASVPIVGRLGDIHGKRRLLLIVTGCLFAGSVVCALSSSLTALVVGRGIQGLAVGILPLTLSAARDELPRERMTATAMAISAAMGVGVAAGPILPGLTGDFHRTFWVLTGLAVVSMASLVVAVPPSRPGHRVPVDIPGGVLLAVVLVLVLLPLSKGSDWGWGSPVTLGMFGAGLVLAVGWGWFELRRRHPFVDLRLNGRRPVVLIQWAGVGSGFAMFGNAMVNSTILQAPEATGYGLGLSLFETGLAFLPGAVAMIVGARTAGMVIRRWGARPAFVAGAVLIAGLYAMRLLLHANVTQVVTLFALVYVGTGLIVAATTVLIMERVPQRDTGAVLAIHEVARFTGQSAFGSLFGAVTGWLVVQVAGQNAPSWSAIVVLSIAPTVAALVTASLALGLRPVRDPARPEPAGAPTAGATSPSAAAAGVAVPEVPTRSESR